MSQTKWRLILMDVNLVIIKIIKTFGQFGISNTNKETEVFKMI